MKWSEVGSRRDKIEEKASRQVLEAFETFGLILQ